MGILDFIKKFKKEKKVEKLEKEKISFSQIPEFINKKESELKEKEKIILTEIKERINFFSKEIPQKIINLENVDVKAKKSEDRFKSIVIKSRDEYLKFLNNFLENLSNLKKENLEEFTSNVDRLYSNFNKSTHKNYERTTILIGKEMAELKKVIKSLLTDLSKIIQENKEIPDSLKKSSILKSNLEDLKNLENTIKTLKKEIKNFEEEKLKTEKEKEKLLSEINKIEEGKEHKEYLEKKEKISYLEDEIKRDIENLKQKINFKALANFFHIFKDKMKIIKEYKDNFLKKFEQDAGRSILYLLEESGLNEKSINQKVEEIKDKKTKIQELSQKLEKNILEELLTKKEKIDEEINELNSEKSKKQKKLEEIENTKQHLIEKTKEKLEEFNTEVIS